MSLKKERMSETWYRSSRCCRVLGNPTAYLIVKSLGEARKTPSELAEDLGMTLPAISTTLRHLREIDMVRYLTQGSTKQYWLKDRALLNALGKLEEFVEGMRQKQE